MLTFTFLLTFSNHIPALQNPKITPYKDTSVNLMSAIPSDSQADSVSDWLQKWLYYFYCLQSQGWQMISQETYFSDICPTAGHFVHGILAFFLKCPDFVVNKHILAPVTHTSMRENTISTVIFVQCHKRQSCKSKTSGRIKKTTSIRWKHMVNFTHKHDFLHILTNTPHTDTSSSFFLH